MTAGVFRVVLTQRAREDLRRLLRFALGQARYEEDLARALASVRGLREQIELRLSRTPYLYRHAGPGLSERELIVPAPNGGYVVLYDITDSQQVTVLAVRHQFEDDYL